MERKRVTCNGQEYYLVPVENEEKLCVNYVIVRTTSAGVFAGEIVRREGKELELKNARRLWRWSGAASLSQLAMEGVKKPTECRFPCEVISVTLTEATEILPCTERARRSIMEVPIWKA